MKPLSLLLLFLPIGLLAQTSTQNYTKTTAYQVATQDGVNAASGATLTTNDQMANITYYDGLGRPKQTIAVGLSPNEKDLVTHIPYDGFGRQHRNFLPVPASGNNGEYRSNAEATTLAYYNTPEFDDTENPYTERIYEDSPLNRVLEVGAPGNKWQADPTSDRDRTIKTDYDANSWDDLVRWFAVGFENNNTQKPTLVDRGVYPAGELYKITTKNENWRHYFYNGNSSKTETYTNKQGQVVLKRSYSYDKWHDTYYVYDDYGNQTFVIPPEVQTYSSIWQQGSHNSVSLRDYNPFTTPMHENDRRYGSMYLRSYNKSIRVYFRAYNLTTPLTCKSSLLFDASLLGLGVDFISGSVTGHVYYTTEDGDRHFNSLTGYFVGNTFFLSGLPTEPVTRLYFNANHIIGEVRNDQPVISDQLDDMIYQYRYDHRNRLVEKKIPGKGWEYIAYDNLDRPVLTADANLRANNQALKTEYDAFDRVTKTGIVNGVSTTSHSSFANHSNDNINTLLSENYYDRYYFNKQGLSLPSTAVQGIQTQGLQTGSRVKILGTSQFVTTLIGYDDKGRPIYTGNHNPATGVTESQIHTLDFVGRTTQTTTNHQKQGQSAISLVDDYTYDHAGRLTQHNQTLNGNQETLVQNTYDELGQLVQKTLGGGLQTVDYRYNVRGWLRHINDADNLGNEDLFGFEIDYGWLFNGNISKTYWATANDHVQHRYSYYYDGLDRLTAAYHYAPGMSWGAYNVNGIQYDRNGNLKRLIRRGFEGVGIDYLNYSYQGNQLQNVTDYFAHSEGLNDRNTTGYDYRYDPNGNLIEDKNKGITNIDYNHLNLPENITVDNESHNDEIVYLYDASGTKLKKTVGNQTTTYTPSVVYKNDQAALIATPEGYIDMQHNPPLYVYQYHDHLGNNRLSYADTNGNGAIDTPFSSGIPVWSEDFEDVVEGEDWDGSANSWGWPISAFDDNFSYTGTTSGMLQNNTGTHYEIACHSNDWVTIDNAEPTLYRYSGWVYIEPNVRHAQIFFFMKTADERGFATSHDYVLENTKGKWTYMQKVVMVPPEIKTLNIRIDNDSYWYNVDSNAKVWFDDLKIERLGSHNEILSETNYYPFGMVHKGYNELVTSSSLGENWKYQGQERNYDLGLNTDQWKYRISDPSIGRFWQIDPLAEDYVYNATYAFQENKLGLGIELEGLELKKFNEGAQEAIQGIKKMYNEATVGDLNRQMAISKSNNGDLKDRIKNQGISNKSQALGNIANGSVEAVKGGAKLVGESLENTGDVIAGVGIATAQPEVILIGELISTIGAILNAAVDLSVGKSIKEVGIKAAVKISAGELGEQAVKATAKAGGESKITNTIIKAHEVGYEKIVNERIVPKIVDEQKD